MRNFVVLLSVILLVQGSPVKPPPPTGTSDKLESFPWIKASKAKARFGTTTQPPCTTAPPTQTPVLPPQQPQPIQPVMTPEMLQNYLASLAAQLQPFIPQNISPQDNSQTTSVDPELPAKKPKGKMSKLKIRDAPDSTTEAYWKEEKKLYPDSLYDEFYLDWLRKRQVEEIQVATPNPMNIAEQTEMEPTGAEFPQQTQPQQSPPPQMQGYPSVPLMPYLMPPFMSPLAGFKVSKAMAQAQVNAALAAMNITTTQKPVKIKLKIPIPGGSDLASVVASGIAGFPPGTTYELSKKK